MGTLVYLSLGSNLGQRENYIREALARIQSQVGEILNTSSYFETEPWGFVTDAQFLNICASLQTNLSPFELLNNFQLIEKELGREQKSHSGYASRVIDIDILTFGNQLVETEALTIPHPQMENRKFVLLPLAEIAPDFTHPKSAKTIKQIMAICNDESSVLIYESK
ncbi:2-amino-4-hydroxy-6-hydroxymethyldihydropteridine diphosphokinase [Crocinitomicaceae bacterium]|nr:2-amino-4-hydroxy-6-hydroxymethyldihydropteridine diphosphokinase [Crocinitomicaceae bacterium]